MSNKVVGVVINQREIGYVAEGAIRLLNYFKEFNIPVLGGDVYRVDKNTYIPTYNYWSVTHNKEEQWQKFVHRVNDEAIQYIEKYLYDTDMFFVFVCRL